MTDGTAFVVALSAAQAVPIPISLDVFMNVRGHLALAQAVNKLFVLIRTVGPQRDLLIPPFLLRFDHPIQHLQRYVALRGVGGQTGLGGHNQSVTVLH